MISKNNHWLPIITAVLTVGVSCASAQNNNEDEDIFELSPFSIAESENIGYMGTNTLAGTRIKSDIKDVATAISIYTEEFMEDIGSTNAEELLVYTAGTEVPGLAGNFANVSAGGAATLEDDGSRRQPQDNIRIRGLALADLTRQFFATNIPFDTYNTTSITVNRGSNSILFGLGSPAGIIENSLKQARFSDLNELDVRFDSFGSRRLTADFNKEVIEDKLAIRIIALNENREWDIEPAFERDERYFGTMTLRPFGRDSDTTIRANFESGEITANRPRMSPPVDALSAWWDPTFNNGARYPDRLGSNGRPYIDPANEGYNVIKSDGTLITPAFYFNIGNFLKTPGIVFQQPTDVLSSGVGNEPFITGDRTFSPGPGIPSYPVNQPSFATLRASALAMRVEGVPFNGFYQNKQITDPTIFNYNKLLLDGPNKREWSNFDTFNISLEQLFLDKKAGIEVTFDRQSYDDGWFADVDGGRGRFLYVDTNITLQNGDTNPNFGRPFITGARSAAERFIDRETVRVQGYYKLDFTELMEDTFLGKVLGVHNFTGLYDEQTIDRFNVGYNGNAWGVERLNYVNSRTNTNVSRITQRNVGTQIYLGESFANASSPVGWNIQNPKVPFQIRPTEGALVFNENTQQFEQVLMTTTQYPDEKSRLTNGGNISKQELESAAVVLQSFWWDNLLVSTLGYREDEATIWENTNPPFGPEGNRLVDPDNFSIPSSATGSIETDVFSYGLVGHVPDGWLEHIPVIDGVSLHYSESENFIPSPGRVNIAGAVLAPEGGTTEERGFSMELLEGKVFFKANWYETSQSNVTERAPGIIANEAELRELPLFANAQPFSNFRNYVDPTTLLPKGYTREFAAFLGATPVDANGDGYPDDGSISVLNPPGGLVATTNVVSTGFEFETVINPTTHWSIMFNAVQQEVVRSGTAPALARLIAERVPIFETIGDLPQSEQGDENITGRMNRTAVVPIKSVLAQDGSPLVNEVREWRWNLATNYNFSDGPLSGFGVGGGARWQDDIAIGYGVKYNEIGAETLDTDNPIYGESELNVDLWLSYKRPILNGKIDWKVQLNIRNVSGDDDLIPTFANPNGEIAGWRIREPRSFILSNTFMF
jgi:catecholate siderophore receptor